MTFVPFSRPALALALTAAVVLAGCSRDVEPNTDPDGDGLPTATEEEPFTITIRTLVGDVSRDVRSDGNLSDTDGDGLDDLTERRASTDPSSPDTDDDDLLDGKSITLSATDPRVAVWRALAIVESPQLTFVGELSLCPELGGLKPTEVSSDRPIPDKLPDGREVRGWDIRVRNETRRVLADPCTPDADRDTLPDDVEFDRGTDPREPDTDGDGVRDAEDADPLWNLILAFDSVTSERPGLRIEAISGAVEANLTTPGSATLDVNDHGPYHELVVALLLRATQDDGSPALVFGEQDFAVVRIDVQNGTARIDGLDEVVTGPLAFDGPDGRVTIEWSIRRV